MTAKTQLSLNDAILQTVEFFLSNGKTFSMFDVTTVIRGDLLADKYEVDGYADASKLYHDLVKLEFQNMLDVELDHLSVVDTSVAPNGGQYRVYGEANTSSVVPTSGSGFTQTNPFASSSSISAQQVQKKPSNPFDPSKNPFSGNKTTTKITPVVPDTVKASPASSKTDQILKIKNYMLHKGKATIKQIQSSLKTKGVTCDDILSMLGTMTNVTVIPSGGAVSKYVVTCP